jgi:hypothetical protein
MMTLRRRRLGKRFVFYVLLAGLLAAGALFLPAGSSGGAPGQESRAGLPVLASRGSAQIAHNDNFLPLLQLNYPSGQFVPLEILGNHDVHRSYTGSLHISGEVINHTGRYMSNINIGVRLYNRNGSLLRTGSAATFLTSLSPWDRTCFEVIFNEVPSGWRDYEPFIMGYSFDGPVPPRLTDLWQFGYLHRQSSNDPYPEWWIEGEVKNDAGRRVDFVKAIGTLYRSSGRVVDCGMEYVNALSMNAGQVASYSIKYWGQDFSSVESYRVQLDGFLP